MKRLSATAAIRKGTTRDLQAILELRAALPMPNQIQTKHGGFLLGSSPEQYLAYLSSGLVWILELKQEASAFCIAFPDKLLRQSEFWQRKNEIHWLSPEKKTKILDQRIAYLDQLAARPSPKARYWTIALALHVLDELFTDCSAFSAHDFCVTTTVMKPICNQAAWPLLNRAKATRIGELDEYYPSVGEIKSAVFAIDKQVASGSLHALRRRFQGRDLP